MSRMIRYAKQLRNLSDKDILKNIEEEAYRIQLAYRGCAQTTLKALQDNLDIGDSLTFRAAGAFISGIGRKGDVCGALTGGLMAIGIVFGRGDLLEPGEPVEGGESNYQKCNNLAGELYDTFKKEFGAVRCFDIQESLFGRHFDVTTPEVKEMKRTGELFNILSKKCCMVVQKGARLAAEIILREMREEKKSYL